MKRCLVLITLFAALTFAAQDNFSQNPSRYTHYSYMTDTIKGAADAVTFYSPSMADFYDVVSVQLAGATYGAGDSVRASVSVWQSNDLDYTDWDEITANRDTIETTTDGVIVNDTNFEGLWYKVVATGISLDTVVVRCYWLQKKTRETSY